MTDDQRKTESDITASDVHSLYARLPDEEIPFELEESVFSAAIKGAPRSAQSPQLRSENNAIDTGKASSRSTLYTATENQSSNSRAKAKKRRLF